MSYREKAEQLVKLFWIANNIYSYDNCNYLLIKIDEIAKKCALIAVDEILESIHYTEYPMPTKDIDYWNQVKTEIELL